MSEIRKGGILITGGTGSFGQAFVREAIDRYERICIFSRGEHAQASMREQLQDHPSLRWFIGDVRDRDRLRRAMEGCEEVVHAAALKRVEVGEYCPIEMVRTNVMGAINVIEAAQDARVRKVVALSTDKACAAKNAYGASKLMMEKMMLAANNTVSANGPLFSVTRYGNIAGSQGSVIPRWRQIIRDKGVIQVTDPNATRFWMTIQQAVALVENTINMMRGGEFVVPDLPAYRLGDLLEAMNPDGIKHVVTGLGQGEKLHESMVEGSPSDNARRMSVEELREALEGIQ